MRLRWYFLVDDTSITEPKSNFHNALFVLCSYIYIVTMASEDTKDYTDLPNFFADVGEKASGDKQWFALPIGIAKVPNCGFLFHMLDFTDTEKEFIIIGSVAGKSTEVLQAVLARRHPSFRVLIFEHDADDGTVQRGNVYIGGEVSKGDTSLAEAIMKLKKTELPMIIITDSLAEYESDVLERMTGGS